MLKRAVVAFCLCLTVALAQERGAFEGLPAIVLSNDKLQMTIVTEGGAMTQLTLADDAAKINPLWNPYWIAREAKLNAPTSLARGHFICLDGFGPASPAERAAGLMNHGEAYTLPWRLTSYEKQRGVASATFAVTLPLVQENLTRTVRLVDGEQVIWVDTEVENLLAFDRPVFWGEHATISAPFLEPGKVAIDMPVVKAKTKGHGMQPNPTRQLKDYVDFTWPAAPTVDGGTLDMRTAPMRAETVDHTTSLLDPSRRLVFVTALHPEKQLMIGWVFRREEFPWVQTWLQYPGPNRMTRGLEFATQPFDLTRADVLRNGPLFDTPVFRILPAKSKIAASFLMFYTRVPTGFQRVDDVRLENGTLIIDDLGRRVTIRLPASRPL